MHQAIMDIPLTTLATSPTSYDGRQALPSQEKRTKDDEVAAGSTAKQARTAEEITRERPDTHEPTTARRRINNITVTTKTGDETTTASSEDMQEQRNVDKILKGSIIYNNGGFDGRKQKAGTNKEIQSTIKQIQYVDTRSQYKRRYRIWKNRTLRCRMLRVYIQV